ncbi:hypothetical protein BDW75DRAFT_242051 [Aspergillus navahoensis]
MPFAGNSRPISIQSCRALLSRSGRGPWSFRQSLLPQRCIQSVLANFSVTNFWPSFSNSSERKKAAALHLSIGASSMRNRTETSLTPLLEWARFKCFVFSILPNSKKLGGGKYSHVYHFESKATSKE